MIEDLYAPSPTLKMEAEGSSETSVTFYQTTRYHISEYANLHIHRHENLKSDEVNIDYTFY
jgi:hypothetical protein